MHVLIMELAMIYNRKMVKGYFLLYLFVTCGSLISLEFRTTISVGTDKRETNICKTFIKSLKHPLCFAFKLKKSLIIHTQWASAIFHYY